MILNPLTKERMYEVHQHPLSICELSHFSPGCPPTGGHLVAAKDSHEAFLLLISKTPPATYPGYLYPIKQVIFDHRKEPLYMNSLQFYKNLDAWPFTGIRHVNFDALLILTPFTKPFFDGSPDHEQLQNITPGKIYHITEVKGFGDVADFFFLDDTGTKTKLGSFFFEEPPADQTETPSFPCILSTMLTIPGACLPENTRNMLDTYEEAADYGLEKADRGITGWYIDLSETGTKNLLLTALEKDHPELAAAIKQTMNVRAQTLCIDLQFK